MTILERLIYYFNHSAAADIYHNVISVILANLKKASQMTIYDLADLCHVSTTTISRMCKLFNFESYHQFRIELTETIDNYYFYNRYLSVDSAKNAGVTVHDLMNRYLDDVVQSVKKLKQIDLAGIDQAVELIKNTDKVCFYSLPVVPTSLLNLQVNLVQAGKQTQVYLDQAAMQDSLSDLNERTLAVFIIPVMRRAMFLANIFNTVSSMIRNQKIKTQTLLILNTQTQMQSQLAGDANLALTFPGQNAIIDNYCFNLYLDLISQAFRLKNIDKI